METCGFDVSLPLLQLAKRANIAHDAAEIIPAANGLETLAVRRIKRYAQLIELGGDQRAAVAFAEDRPVGVEQHVDAAILQISHHARQVRDQHRLADAVQHRPRKIGHLIDDRCEQVPAHIRRRLELLVGAGTGGAQQIAAIGHFQIKADRRTDGDLGALAVYRFVIAARIDARASKPDCRRKRLIAIILCRRPAADMSRGPTKRTPEENFRIE